MTRWRMPPDSWCGYSSDGGAARGCRRRPAASRPRRRRRAAMPRWTRSDSVICRPIFITGLSDVIGSWKIIAISRPQIRRRSRSDIVVSSMPSNCTLPSRIDVAVGQQAHDRARQDRLARARLAHDAERLAPVEREADAVDGANRPERGEEVGLEVAHLEQRPGERPLERCAASLLTPAPHGRRTAAATSPSTLKARIVKNIIDAGISEIHQALARSCWPSSMSLPHVGTGAARSGRGRPARPRR